MGNDRDEWREEALQAKHESGGSDIARQKRRPFLRRHSVSDDGNTEREEDKGSWCNFYYEWSQSIFLSIDEKIFNIIKHQLSIIRFRSCFDLWDLYFAFSYRWNR